VKRTTTCSQQNDFDLFETDLVIKGKLSG